MELQVESLDSAKYELLSDAYFATGGFYDGSYIVQFPDEPSAKYTYRKNASSYSNYFRQIVDANILPVSEGIERKTESDLHQMFMNDCDGHGSTFSRFMDSVRLETLLYGFEVVFLDTPTEQPETMEEAKQKRTIPKVIKVTPKQIGYITIGGENELLYFSYKSDEVDNQSIYTVYNRGVWYESSTQEPDTSRSTAIGVERKALHEPWLFTYELYRSPWCVPESRFLGLSRMAVAHFNMSTNIVYQSSSTTISFMVYPDPSIKQKDLKLDNNTILLIDPNKSAGKMPLFLTPENTMEPIREQVDAVKSEMYESNNLNVLSTSADASGTSRAYSDIIRISNLEVLSNQSALFENAIFDEFNKITGQTAEIVIKYPDNFATLLLEDKLNNAITALSMNPASENQKKIKSDALVEYFYGFSEDEKNEIVDVEMSNEPDTEEGLD